MSMTAGEIIEAIKDSPLSDEEMGQIMSAATTKIMANAFVAGGLDMMSDPNIWGGATVSTGEMPTICGNLYYDSRCVRDSGHPYDGASQLHRDSKGVTW